VPRVELVHDRVGIVPVGVVDPPMPAVAVANNSDAPACKVLTRDNHSAIIESMSVERESDVVARAQVHAALGEPARLAIVDRLVIGDAAPVELGHELGMASNLLAHHLKQLEAAGLLERDPLRRRPPPPLSAAAARRLG
jgi:DNA-binding transcriptional ArsR family regulator